MILSVLDPRKCKYLKDYSLDFEHAYMTTYLASREACRYFFAALLQVEQDIFFHETLNTARYLEIFNKFVDQHDDDKLQNGYFQQDGATCHTSNESMTEI